MSGYLVSARKYRPTDFSEVVGQSSVTTTLSQAISSGKLAHAYLFCGPRGVGKTTCARIFARVINKADTDADLSFNIFELDAASNNSVDDIRTLIEQVRIPPQTGSYKVYIIDEVHMLSAAAFNAFLKTLEEPPAHAIFVLATTEKHKILPTILSRCQIYDFNRISISDIVGHLEHIAEKEGINADRDALHLIARKADGALRDALTIFDQLNSFSGGALAFDAVAKQLNILDIEYFTRLFDILLQSDIAGAMMLLDEILAKGFDCQHFIQSIAMFARDILICSDPKTIKLFEGTDSGRKSLLKMAAAVDTKLLIKAIDHCNIAEQEYRFAVNQRLRTELLLLQLINLFGSTEKKNNPVASLMETKEEAGVVRQQVSGKEQAEQKEPGQTLRKENPVQANEPAVKKEDQSQSNPSPAEKLPDHSDNKESELKKEDSCEVIRLNTPEDLMNYADVNDDSISLKSLNTSDNDSESKQEPAGTSDLKEQNKPFNQESLVMAWNEFAAQIKKSGKESLYATLTCRKPVITDDGDILFALDNKVQQGDFELEKQELLQYLKQRLKNTGIKLQCQVFGNAHDRSGKPYTTREKFEHLAKKNPALETLRQQLNLDLDY